jgi:hypothetical protein
MDGIVFRNRSVKTIWSVVPRFETHNLFVLEREGDGQECERVGLLDSGDSVVPQLLAIL